MNGSQHNPKVADFMRFTKMHGAGNDYVYVDCFNGSPPSNLPDVARRISDRHLGVGGDGLILICPSEIADARMQMFNADGTEAEMCGNGIRCVAKYVYDHGICRRQQMDIETASGVLKLTLIARDQCVEQVRVDLGAPILQADRIPTSLPGNPVIDVELPIDDQLFRVSAISMGNPHCVVFVETLSDDLVGGWGPRIERSDCFPQRTNVEFVQVLSRAEVRQRTWERGSGETMACGTGAAAVCVAGALSGRTDRKLLVHLNGGDLSIDWNTQDNHVYKTGPAVEVFSGEWNP